MAKRIRQEKKAAGVGDPIRVLVIGSEADAEQVVQIPGWEPAVYVVHDLTPLPEEFGGAFDGCLVMNQWQRVGFWESENALRRWVECLVPGGELRVVVPSLEWGARQVLADMPSGAVLPHIFGSQTGNGEFHLSGFTMRRLRVLMERCGLRVEHANTGQYTIEIDGKAVQADQHYVMGRKV